MTMRLPAGRRFALILFLLLVGLAGAPGLSAAEVRPASVPRELFDPWPNEQERREMAGAQEPTVTIDETTPRP